LKKLFIPLLLVIGVSVYAQNFEWSLGLVNSRQNNGLDFSKPVRLNHGDIINLYIQSTADCWAYIIAQDSDRNVVVFYSGRISAGRQFRTNPIQLLPPSGQDMIYIIVSRNPEAELERRIAAYERDSAFRNGRNIINSVMSLRRDYLNLAEAPERPVQLGGTFRGTEVPEGKSYSGADRYIGTILLNH
jgi:hypothetical protein